MRKLLNARSEDPSQAQTGSPHFPFPLASAAVNTALCSSVGLPSHSSLWVRSPLRLPTCLTLFLEALGLFIERINYPSNYREDANIKKYLK